MLAPWRKSYGQPRQHTKKQRHYFANKGPYSQSYGFSSSHVWMWELDYKESWVPKNWCFWTVVLEKILESPLDYKESQPVQPKRISPEYSLKRQMLKLKLQYFGHLMWRTDLLKRPWCWERLKAGGEGDNRGWDGWMTSPTQWTWIWVNFRHWWWTGRPGVLLSMELQRVRRDWVTELTWTELCCSVLAAGKVGGNYCLCVLYLRVCFGFTYLLNCFSLCLTLCNSMDCSLPGSSVHRDSPGKNIGVDCYALL